MAITVAAHAEGPHFGSSGQVVISDDQPLGTALGTTLGAPSLPSSTSSASFEFASLSDNGGSGTAFGFAPAIDYFVTNGLSLGVNGLVEVVNPAHSGNTSSSGTAFGIAPRVGFNLPLSDTVSFWPKLYFSYATLSVNASATSPGAGTVSGSVGYNDTSIGIFAPLLFHPVAHFFFGIGPNLSTQLSNNATSNIAGLSPPQNQPKVTEVGLQATLGGWFLGN
jgi:hypothetical protein